MRPKAVTGLKKDLYSPLKVYRPTSYHFIPDILLTYVQFPNIYFLVQNKMFSKHFCLNDSQNYCEYISNYNFEVAFFESNVTLKKYAEICSTPKRNFLFFGKFLVRRISLNAPHFSCKVSKKHYSLLNLIRNPKIQQNKDAS